MKTAILVAAIAAGSLGTVATVSAGNAIDIQNRHNALANLPFDGGYPAADSSQALQKELAFQRATQAYLWALPMANMQAMKEGHAGMMKGTSYNKIAIYEDRLKAHTLITTPNSDVIYGLAWLDVGNTGPLVIDMPASLQSLVDDMWHDALVGPVNPETGKHYLGDMGNAGPDKGKGGLFLILPPGESREHYDAKKYHIYESNTNDVFLFIRSFFMDMNNTDPAVKRVEEINVYPLKGKASKMEYHHVSEIPSNSIAPRDWTYFETVDRMIQDTPLAEVDPYMHGVLATLGIKKGHAFKPSEAQKKLLTQAVQTGWKMAKEIAYNFDEFGSDVLGDTTFWEGRQWVAHGFTIDGDQYSAQIDTSYNDVVSGHTNVDAKAHMYINHYSISNGMINARPGAGAKYAGAYKDAAGAALNGSCTYRIDLPADVPAGLFWSVTAYDAETAAGVPSDNKYPSIGDRDNPIQNADGSTTLYFGPKLPKNAAADNFLHTPEGVGWFSVIRLYAPKESLFKGTWIPGDFVKQSCK